MGRRPVVKPEYLGDPYDAVKRLWCELLSGWAPLCAETRFIPDVPEDFRARYTLFTRIPMLTEDQRAAPFSILNDPDTGIRLPDARNQVEGRTHVTVASITNQFCDGNVRCVVTFDQSYDRSKDRSQQRQKKMDYLTAKGFPSFYYVRPQVSFLFTVRDASMLQTLRGILTNPGLPANRLECLRHRDP
jgi:hypothetical protein